VLAGGPNNYRQNKQQEIPQKHRPPHSLGVRRAETTALDIQGYPMATSFSLAKKSQVSEPSTVWDVNNVLNRSTWYIDYQEIDSCRLFYAPTGR